MFALLAAVLLAPPAPPHDLWIEGESCTDHDFTVIGREEAFAGCYGGAILQLQTASPAPEGGWHAGFEVNLPAAGWYELSLCASRTDTGQASPYSLEVDGYRPRRIERYPIAEPFGHERTGQVFGWFRAGRFRLDGVRARITVRCDTRRGLGDYLVYLDALAVRRIEPPPEEPGWLEAAPDGPLWTATRFEATATADPRLHVCCDGRFTAELDGRPLAEGGGWQQATVAMLPGLTTGFHRLDLHADGPVCAWITATAPDGTRRRLAATGRGWPAARYLGPACMPPYGDMEVQPVARVPAGPIPIPVKIGNLSVNLLMAAARGEPLPEPGRQMDYEALRDLASVGLIEDYLCWLPAEPERDAWQWEFYRRNQRDLAERGMRYGVYPWVHFPPAWAVGSELWDPMVSLKNGRTTWAPSIWSPKTDALFDRFYAAMREAFGDTIDQVYVSMICDYGEVGYPIGLADWVVPAEYKGADFWVGDEHARADFRARMIARAGGLAPLNERWGTDFATVEAVDYPAWCATEGPDFATTQALPPAERARVRRRWLDFVGWYLESMVGFAGRAVGISRRHFPGVPHEIKIGFGSERVMFGADYTHFVARSKTDGYTVRSTHGKLPPYFYKRFSTAAMHYGVPLVTEPPSDVSREEEVERIFKDATCGTTEYFDYPQNLLGATDIFARYGRYLEGRHARAEAAFFFPTTDHRLRGAQSMPQPLWDVTIHSRDLFDFDVVDERLILDGALAHYDSLILVQGNVMEADVIDAIAAWTAAGGHLLACDFGPIETVEGDATPGDALLARAIRIPPGDALPVADAVGQALGLVHTLPDGRRDGVWTARLPNRTLLYNSLDEPREVAVEATTIALPPRSLGSIEADGSVLVP